MFLNDITIVITTFYSEKKLLKCLKSISNKCKVIIIENSGNTELKKYLEVNYKNLNCIVSKENLGYARSNNLGIKMVKTKYALILNPDTVLEEHALENFINASIEIKDFAILAPWIQTEEDKKEDKSTLKTVSVDSVKGFAMFLNLEKFDKIGFFDENFFLYFEDIDLCKRVIKSGHKIFLLPQVKIYHDGSKSVNFLNHEELEINRNWHWMWSSHYYHKKYQGSFISFIIFLPKLLSSLVKFIIFNLLGNKNRGKIYLFRFLGLLNSIIGKKSRYRPNI